MAVLSSLDLLHSLAKVRNDGIDIDEALPEPTPVLRDARGRDLRTNSITAASTMGCSVRDRWRGGYYAFRLLGPALSRPRAAKRSCPRAPGSSTSRTRLIITQASVPCQSAYRHLRHPIGLVNRAH